MVRKHVTEQEVRKHLEHLRAKGLVDYNIETDEYRINDLGRAVLKRAEEEGR